MTQQPAAVPSPEQWPILTFADCPTCQRPTDVAWIGLATTLDGAQVHVWRCRACPADFTTRVTHWPVLDGPDCPYCGTEVTCWAALDPDNAGDLWTCEEGHEFTLTPEGIVITPDNQDLTDWAQIWRSTRRLDEGA